jgi:hypothetical protein
MGIPVRQTSGIEERFSQINSVDLRGIANTEPRTKNQKEYDITRTKLEKLIKLGILQHPSTAVESLSSRNQKPCGQPGNLT